MATLGYTESNALVSAIIDQNRAGYVLIRFLKFDANGQVIEKQNRNISLSTLMRIKIRKRKDSRNILSASQILSALV